MSDRIRPRQLAADAPLLLIACGPGAARVRIAMIRVNLLPHREQKRQARQRQFISLAVGLAVLGVAIVGLFIVIAAQIENQNGRNTLLKTEIAKLDEQIKEIDKLREQTRRCWRASRSSRRCSRTGPGSAPARPAGAAAPRWAST